MSCDRPMTEPELKQWIVRRLGGPVACVELDDSQLEDAIGEARQWFAAKKGVDRDITLDLFSGQVEYTMPEDCDAVIDVAFQVSPLDISLIFAPHIIADEKIPYNAFAAPSSAGLYSSLVQSLQYVEMAKKILNAERNWLYFPHKNILLLLPNPKGGGKAFVEYKSSCITLEHLPARDQEFIRRYALAWAKHDLGMIRTKYSSWPTAQGQTQLNGTMLIDQAVKEMEKLEDQLYDSAKPMPFFTA